MSSRRIALVTGANQGIGKQVARELADDGTLVFVGARDLARGSEAAAEIGGGAIAVQLDVTDDASIAAAAQTIERDAGRLDLLVNNAGIATVRQVEDVAAFRAQSVPSIVPIAEVKAVWDVNVFGVLAVFQRMLPLLRRSSGARVVNVTSALGSLTIASDPAFPLRGAFDPAYAASKTALNAVTLSMMIELTGAEVKVNLVSPGFARTALTNFEGTESVEDAAREVVRVCRLGADEPGDTYTTWEGGSVPW